MKHEELPRNNGDVVRITITLKTPVYEDIKKMSRQMGLRPSTWITMLCTSKVNGISLHIDDPSPEQLKEPPGRTDPFNRRQGYGH